MMKRHYLFFLLVLVTCFTACDGESRATPTPFPDNDLTGEALNPASSLRISLSDLVQDPEAYANRFMELTGRYRRLPLLVCETDPHPAPATWQLVGEDGSVVAIGGFDSQVRSLLPNELTVTVAGVWQLFDGPVGCGKNATTVQIWYLKASDIVSPSPIARVTLTPTGFGGQLAEGDDETAVSTPDFTGNTPLTPTLMGEAATTATAPSGASTPISPPPGGNATGTSTASSGEPGGDSATNTPTPAGSSGEAATPTAGSGTTPNATSSAATPTSSGGGGGNATPTSVVLSTATRDPNDFDMVEFDELSPQSPVLELLAVEEAHLWPILFENTGAITITAVSESSMNLVLEILDPANNVVQQANDGGNGALESIVNAQLNVALSYQIRVYDLNASEGEYCLIFSEEGGFPDTIKGRLEYGQTINRVIEEFAINYWCFLGSDGDSVTISANATGSNGDFVVGLFGPPDFTAIGNVFTEPELADVALTEDGMYIIGVLDLEASEAGYAISLESD